MFERSQIWIDGETNRREFFRVFETQREYADHVEKMNPERINRFCSFPDGWTGCNSRARLLQWLSEGRAELVARSDEFLSEFDTLQFVTARSAIVPSVSGGAPNVGAFLAGSPVAMRMRVKTVSDVAPLRIVADSAASGDVSKEALEKRGAAILAIVRMLSAVRPVELYLGTSNYFADGRRMTRDDAVYELVRIDTAPLDLIRAAYLLTDVSATRVALYATGAELSGCRDESSGGVAWSYGSPKLSRERGAAAIDQMFADGGETVYLAPPFSNDPHINNPTQFIRDMLSLYGGKPAERAA